MPAYLIWNHPTNAETEAKDSLSAVEVIYNLPYSEGDYVMDTWDNVTNSDTNEEEWGFHKPEARLGKLLSALIAVLVGNYDEVSEMPSDWVVI